MKFGEKALYFRLVKSAGHGADDGGGVRVRLAEQPYAGVGMKKQPADNAGDDHGAGLV
jgi:hypothetical protein